MVTDSFIMHIETEDFYRDIADDVDKGLILLNMIKMIIDHYLQGKTKKSIGKFKDALNGQIMTEFIALRAKNIHF